MSIEVSKVVLALRHKLQDYRKKRPNLSLRAIAKRSHVNRYFIRKILSEEESKMCPLDFSQVLMLTKFLSSSDSFNDDVDESSKELRSVLLKIFDYNFESDFPVLNTIEQKSDLDYLLDDFDNFIIYILASIPKGTDLSIIKKILSPSNYHKIDHLVDHNIISNLDGIIQSNYKNFARLSSRHIYLHLPELIKRFSSLEDSNDDHFIGLYYQNVNKQALHELKEIHKDYFLKINKFLDNNKNHGNIPIYVTLCQDTIGTFE